jgi:hypothetical protein
MWHGIRWCSMLLKFLELFVKRERWCDMLLEFSELFFNRKRWCGNHFSSLASCTRFKMILQVVWLPTSNFFTPIAFNFNFATHYKFTRPHNRTLLLSSTITTVISSSVASGVSWAWPLEVGVAATVGDGEAILKDGVAVVAPTTASFEFKDDVADLDGGRSTRGAHEAAPPPWFAMSVATTWCS